MTRLSTGIERLDQMLGGGLLPGTLTVVMGATGIGKSQLGLSFAARGLDQEGQRGIVFDLTARGDSQNHAEYAERLCDWKLTDKDPNQKILTDEIWDRELSRRDYMHIFHHGGRRVTASDMNSDQWREWKYEQAKKLDQAIAFFYGNFVHGVRRCVIDGVEPATKAADSIQLEMFEYIYHQVIRKEHDWLARDLFRVAFRENAERIAANAYNHQELACLLLYTSHEVMLDDLIIRPIQSGDVLSNANTILLMGKTRHGSKMGRALHVAKHRGSACDESIVPYEITEQRYFDPMTDTQTFLSATKFGVAGASSDRNKYGNKVLRCYLQNGRAAVPIHPLESEVEGQQAYASLADAPTIESLSIITPPAVTEQIVEDAIAVGVRHVWIQPGAESPQAIERAEAAGLTVIAGGPCLLVVLGFREQP